MRSYEEPKYLNKHRTLLPRPPYVRRKKMRGPRSLEADGVDAEASRTKLAGLIQEHRDLDGVISLLFEARTCDPSLIARMKKRKLQLKDEIARFENAVCEAQPQE